MSLSAMFRRRCLTFTTMAVRAIASRSSYPSTTHHIHLKNCMLGKISGASILPRYFSSKRTNAKGNLSGIISSEIEHAEEEVNHDGVQEMPKGFPFVIQDNPGQQTVTLKREYQGEIINVEVHLPNPVDTDGDDDGEDNGDADGNDEEASQSCISMVVSVSKGDGSHLEFGCTAFPDEISIDTLLIKEEESSEDQLAYEGPEFSDLDEDLQRAFHEYLEDRGIKPSNINYLNEYMINKDNKEYLMWLRKLQKFVEK